VETARAYACNGRRLFGLANLADDVVESVRQDIYLFSAALVGGKVCKSG